MNIIITGASRGIGYELVKLLSENPANNILAVSRNREKLDQLKKECFQIHPESKITPVVYDLSDALSYDTFILEINKNITSVDILINNAGAIINKPFAEITNSDLEYVYNVNVFSVVRLIQGLLPLMDNNSRSHIVNISSMGGFQGSSKFSGLSAYSSSKAALACLTECLAEEFKDKNIAFNCLALGSAQTEMLNEAFPGYKAPLSAIQIAKYIGNFALTAQNFMNGKIIPVSMSTP